MPSIGLHIIGVTCAAATEFDQLLSFDRPKSAPKETSSDDVLAVLDRILADRRERK